MADGDEWSTNANEAIDISLVTASSAGLDTIESFHPKFTYPMFGEEEQIFGHKSLKIHLRFHANDMRPILTVSCKEKFPATGETEATNVEEALREFLPPVAYQKASEFRSEIKNVKDDWHPPGELIASLTSKGANYEVWKGSLATPAMRQYVTRIQILVPFFIEAGTPLDLDQPDLDRWTVFLLFQKRPKPAKDGEFSYVFAGYSTVYRFFFMQVATPPTSPKGPGHGQALTLTDDLKLDNSFDLSQLPSRTRISQFLIIPPFQRKGLGDKLYSTIYHDYLKHPQTVEITVEDPNEAFDDLRDVSDLRFLRDQADFLDLRIDRGIQLPKDGVAPSNVLGRSYEAIRRKYKIAPRQFARVLEMQLMSKLADSVRPGIELETAASSATQSDKHEYRLWRLMVKQRIYRQNKDVLGQLEVHERVSKLDETASSVEFDYARILSMVDARNSTTTNGKRKLEEKSQLPSSKKAKVEEV